MAGGDFVILFCLSSSRYSPLSQFTYADMDQGTMLSKVSVTTAIERNVIVAFRMLHERGICHGDVRGPNILVKNDNSVVILDFEMSCSNADQIMLLEEENELRHMLQAMKNRKR